ncbi:MAG: arsenite efflux transporter metallochaperone ArsD [Persicimonas sp.]
MTAKKLTVFDPSMCCSTGVCGPDVDQELVRFSADLEWLGKRGVNVERFNLSQEPGAFAEDSDAKSLLESDGEAGLPLFKVDGQVKAHGEYPSRDVLAEWFGVEDDSANTSKADESAGCCGGASSTESKSSCC